MSILPVCKNCANLEAFNIPHSFAFQPIVSVKEKRAIGHEALVRGPRGEPALTVLRQVVEDNRYRFDQACRVGAVERAAELGLSGLLFINFYPNAVYKAETCIRRTIEACKRYGFPLENIVFEVSEAEMVHQEHHLLEIFRAYQDMKFKTAIDDFGSGYAGLSFLSQFQPDFLKIDMQLIRAVDRNPVKQAILRGLVNICRDLSVSALAEGVESAGEFGHLAAEGLDLMQGYYFSHPLAIPDSVNKDCFSPCPVHELSRTEG